MLFGDVKKEDNLSRNNKFGFYGISLITAMSAFSYGILYSSLSLYLTEALGFSILSSNSLVGIFISFNFLLHLFAGYIGGKLVSNKTLLATSLTSQLVGGFFIAYMPIEYLKIGLCFYLIGCGFGTTCLNCLLAQLFEKDNPEKREKGFFLNYAALNLGFFLSFLTSGYFYSFNEFKILFQVGFGFNFISLIIFVIFKSNFQQNKVDLHIPPTLYINFLKAIPLILVFASLVLGFYFEVFTNISVISITLLSLLYIAIKAKTFEKTKKYHIYCFLIYVLAAIIFWTLYFIGPMGFVFFLKNNVHHEVLGYRISPQWFMNLDTILIIIGAPLLTYLFQYLRRKSINISISIKFSFALLMIASSWLILLAGIKHANHSGLIGVGWVVIYYVLQSIGELLIAPVGYAMVGKLAPESLQGVMMGTWLMICGVASVLSHYISNAMAVASTIDPTVTNINYLLVFGELGVYALIAGCVLLLFSRKIDSYIDYENRFVKRKLDVNLEVIK